MPISNPGSSIAFPDPEQIDGIASEVTVGADAPILVAAQNSDRRMLTIYNTHFEPIYFDIQPAPTSSKFMFVLQPEGFYEMPSPAFRSEIYAKSSGNSGKVLVRDFSKL